MSFAEHVQSMAIMHVHVHNIAQLEHSTLIMSSMQTFILTLRFSEPGSQILLSHTRHYSSMSLQHELIAVFQ